MDLMLAQRAGRQLVVEQAAMEGVAREWVVEMRWLNMLMEWDEAVEQEERNEMLRYPESCTSNS